MIKKIFILLTFILLFSYKSKAITPEEYLPLWQEGYLDIHQISTGRGNCTFIIFPDSTTMIIDAGDIGNKRTKMPAFPNDSKLPGEWIAIYINHFLHHFNNRHIDYALLTHFHADHIGGSVSGTLTKDDRPYKLSGITQVSEYIPIKKIIDRGWPDYDYPSRESIESLTNFNNYLAFVNYQRANNQIVFEKFEVGSKKQFELCHDPLKYRDIKIQNIYSNGVIWTGKQNDTKRLFPEIDKLQKSEYPNENICSNVIKISYGDFDFYSGGDILGIISPKKPAWWNIETPVGHIVGQVEVAIADHHAYSDAMNPSIINSLSPQIFIIPSWDLSHPQPKTLRRMANSFSDEKDCLIYATGLDPKKLSELDKFIQPCGHIVIRVYPKDKKFQIFVLDPYSLDYRIISKTLELKSN